MLLYLSLAIASVATSLGPVPQGDVALVRRGCGLNRSAGPAARVNPCAVRCDLDVSSQLLSACQPLEDGERAACTHLRACNRGDGPACVELGRTLEHHPHVRDSLLFLEGPGYLYERACLLGDAGGCALARWHRAFLAWSLTVLGGGAILLLMAAARMVRRQQDAASPGARSEPAPCPRCGAADACTSGRAHVRCVGCERRFAARSMLSAAAIWMLALAGMTCLYMSAYAVLAPVLAPALFAGGALATHRASRYAKRCLRARFLAESSVPRARTL